jgi:prepilin-type N-terminal cleavage/methylation domain-containing protein
MTRTDRKYSHAFTLIELLIVVAIIAVLAAIAVPNLLEAQIRAKVSRAKADIRSMVTAVEAYRADSSDYPGDYECFTGYLVALSNPGVRLWTYSETLKRITTPIAYITTLPPENPFGPARGGNWSEMHGYWYVGGRHWRTQMDEGNYSTYFPYYRRTQYLFSSLGPSKRFGSYLPYDPTNGTTSLGDIIYIAGPTAVPNWHSFK